MALTKADHDYLNDKSIIIEPNDLVQLYIADSPIMLVEMIDSSPNGILAYVIWFDKRFAQHRDAFSIEALQKVERS